MNVFIIDGASKVFSETAGSLNDTISARIVELAEEWGHEVVRTFVDDKHDLDLEVEKFVNADLVIYHFPIWWFAVPYPLKQYIDDVLTHGYGKIFKNDGRSRKDPKRNYGKGGLLKGKCSLISTWNAPLEAFTMEGELMETKLPDDGVLFGMRKMNNFIGLEDAPNFHFYDVVKDPNLEIQLQAFEVYLEKILKN